MINPRHVSPIKAGVGFFNKGVTTNHPNRTPITAYGLNFIFDCPFFLVSFPQYKLL